MASTKCLCDNFLLKTYRRIIKGYTTAQAGIHDIPNIWVSDLRCKNAALHLPVSLALFRHSLQCHIPLHKVNILVRHTTFVIAVKTFSKIALGWAFCGPLAWTLRPKAHGLAMNLWETEKWEKKTFSYLLHYCYQSMACGKWQTL